MCVFGNEEGATSSESGKWEAPETFVRTTTKYWLKPDRVVRKNKEKKRKRKEERRKKRKEKKKGRAKKR